MINSHNASFKVEKSLGWNEKENAELTKLLEMFWRQSNVHSGSNVRMILDDVDDNDDDDDENDADKNEDEFKDDGDVRTTRRNKVWCGGQVFVCVKVQTKTQTRLI